MFIPRYWKENEKTTGFYQTVKMKAGLYRCDLSKIENWPAGKILIEFKRKKTVIYALFGDVFTTTFISMVEVFSRNNIIATPHHLLM